MLLLLLLMMLMLLRVHCVCVKVQEVQSSRSPPPTSTTEQKTRPPPLHTRYPLVSTSIEDLFYCSLVRPRSRAPVLAFALARLLAHTFRAEAALFQADLWARPIFKVLRTMERGVKFAYLRRSPPLTPPPAATSPRRRRRRRRHAGRRSFAARCSSSSETRREGDTLQLRKAS